MSEPLQPTGPAQLPPVEAAKGQFFDGLQKAMEEAGIGNFVDGDKPAVQPQHQAEPSAERKLTDPPVRGKARQHFKALEESRRSAEQAWQAEKQELTRQLEEARKGATTTPTTTPNNELEDLRAQLAALDITKAPEFETKYRTPRNVTVTQAANIAGERGADVKAVLALPPGALRDARLAELVQSLPASVGAVVKAADAKLTALAFEESVEVETARATYAQKAQAQEAKRQAEQATRAKALPELINDWKGSVDILDPAKDKRAAAIARDAERFYKGEGMSAKEQAAVALQASMFNAVMEEYEASQATINELQARLQRYEKSFPGGGSEGDGGQMRRPQSIDERIAGFDQGLTKVMSDPMYGGARR